MCPLLPDKEQVKKYLHTGTTTKNFWIILISFTAGLVRKFILYLFPFQSVKLYAQLVYFVT